MAYYVVYAPDDTVTAISIFNDYAGAEESNRRALAREDLREVITYQKSTTSRPVSAAPRTSIDQSPASRPKRRSAAVLARITGVLSALRGGSALPASWNDPVTTSV